MTFLAARVVVDGYAWRCEICDFQDGGYSFADIAGAAAREHNRSKEHIAKRDAARKAREKKP